MKMIGETSLAGMAQAKKAPKCLVKYTTKLTCRCGAIYFESELSLKHNPVKLKLCRICIAENKKQGKKAINEAIIAIAKRKGLI